MTCAEIGYLLDPERLNRRRLRLGRQQQCLHYYEDRERTESTQNCLPT